MRKSSGSFAQLWLISCGLTLKWVQHDFTVLLFKNNNYLYLEMTLGTKQPASLNFAVILDVNFVNTLAV